MPRDLADLQAEVIARGYAHDFSGAGRSLQIKGTNESLALDELRVVETITFDAGTDPGDDTTMYLIESSRGQKGFLILPDSFHVDPQKAAFIDAVLANSRVSA
ncbi:MAG: phosphoribosylpyrophosphate synthetase [Gammaproteobacteria bacterium]|nr:phosphoribosylpyrophosphate synthetase [Gammaproteobacteria bacterium]